MRMIFTRSTRTTLIIFGIFSLLTLSGCAYQPGTYGSALPGFFTGIWHGIISPFSLIGGFFSDVRIFKYPNSGWSYDFGFMVGWLFWISAASEATD